MTYVEQYARGWMSVCEPCRSLETFHGDAAEHRARDFREKHLAYHPAHTPKCHHP